MDKLRRHTKKALIGITGGLVVLVGLILIPYPGPGWLTVFAGLAILATEFTFAQKMLEYGRDRYEMWLAWLKRQSWIIRIGVLSVTALVIVVTAWLLNVFGFASQFIGIDAAWVESPLFK